MSDNPLAPPDTSSPRSTLLGFIDSVNSSYEQLELVVGSYRGSSRLYFSNKEIEEVDRVYENIDLARRTLNFAELPKALAVAEPLFRYRIFQLKEVLDRLELPVAESIPDAQMMASREFKRWTLPGTEITIERVETGSRAGEYLFSPETVERLPEFYARIKHFPYLSDTTAGWYERYRYGGAGLRAVIPLKWMSAMPAWAKAPILDHPIWRWIGMIIVFFVAVGSFTLARYAGTSWAGRGQQTELRTQWAQLARVTFMLLLIPSIIYVVTVNLRFSGLFLEVTTLSLWALFTLTLTGAVWLACSVLAESIVSSQELLVGSIDSQLIRLALRLIATILSVTILIVGAQQLGIPAYSVIAGLGVGGIAFALAAKDSLANLLGSLLIMFEKPFRIGHWIKVAETEGIVESIGFRSTRIRTFKNSLVSIPSDHLVNAAVDNMSMREKQVVEAALRIPYSMTSPEIEYFLAGIGRVIEETPLVCSNESFARLDEFGERSLQILVHFSLTVTGYHAEKKAQHELLLSILRLAESMNINWMAIPSESQQGHQCNEA
ncbi:MAG: mechanosensitive ion channel family protein [Halioglobus sp.]